MAPKDIRSFFGGAAGKSSPGGAKRSSQQPAEQPTPKKAKVAKPSKSPAASPAKKAKGAASASKASTSKATPAKKPAAASKRKAKAADSDSDFEEEAIEEEDDAVIDLDSESGEDEVLPTKRARGSKPTVVLSDSEDEAPKSQSARTLPASLSKPAAPKAKPKSAPAAPSPVAAKPKARKSAGKVDPEANLSPAGKKAIAAVAEAAKALPSSESLIESGAITKMAEGGGGWGGGGGADAAPENHGGKEYPSGHPDALMRYTFVLSGVLDSMYRNEATDYIKRHGGRVTSAVTGKTTFLLCGKETGNSKWRDAHTKGTRLIDEDGLLALVRASEPFAEDAKADAPPSAGASAAPRPVAAASMYGSAGASTSAAAARPSAPVAAKASTERPEDMLWVDKWKPQSAADLVGNGPNLQLMRQWLANWHRIHVLGGEAQAGPGARGAKMDMTKKALLISGAPGTGKTTASQILGREAGFDVVEVNASDTRNKADSKRKEGIGGKMSNRVKEMVTNTAIAADSTAGRKQLLVMDEVDGMSGGDRGGVSDLIASIKVAKLPIICICNDKYKQSLKSLKNHCLELTWSKPTKIQISARLRTICAAEGLSLNQATMDALIESAQGDMRVMLGQLQMHRVRATSLTFDEVRGAAAKDMDKSPFDCARRLLSSESAQWSMMDRMDAVFQDLDLVPLLIQENYINHQPNLAQNEVMAMQVIAKAADAFSAADLANTRIRTAQAWHLAPHAAVLSAVYPAAYMRGNRTTFNPGEMNFPRFTAWLGANSSARKQARVASELNTKLLAAGVVCDRRALRLQYMPTLRLALTRPLATRGADGIDDVVRVMQAYLVSREDFDSIQEITRFKTAAGWGADPMKAVESKTKAAFTRTFNKAGLAVRTTIMVEDGKKTKRAAPAPAEPDEFGGELADAAMLNAAGAEEGEAVSADEVKRLKGVNFTAAAPAKGKGRAASSGKGRGAGAAGRGGKAGAGRGRGKN